MTSPPYRLYAHDKWVVAPVQENCTPANRISPVTKYMFPIPKWRVLLNLTGNMLQEKATSSRTKATETSLQTVARKGEKKTDWSKLIVRISLKESRKQGEGSNDIKDWGGRVKAVLIRQTKDLLAKSDQTFLSKLQMNKVLALCSL